MARRTSFTFSAEGMAQLKAIRERTHVADNGEVIRCALNAYDDLVDLAARGYQMFVRDGDGARWPYSPYIKLSYPGLRRDEINAEAVAAAKGRKPETIFFSGDIIGKIESLKKRSHLSSNVDAIRVALSAFKELVLVLEAGDTFFVRDTDSVETPYNPFQPFGKVSASVDDVDTSETEEGAAVKSPGEATEPAKDEALQDA